MFGQIMKQLADEFDENSEVQDLNNTIASRRILQSALRNDIAEAMKKIVIEYRAECGLDEIEEPVKPTPRATVQTTVKSKPEWTNRLQGKSCACCSEGATKARIRKKDVKGFAGLSDYAFEALTPTELHENYILLCQEHDKKYWSIYSKLRYSHPELDDNQKFAKALSLTSPVAALRDLYKRQQNPSMKLERLT